MVNFQIQKLGELGVMGVLVPQEYGGSGQDTLALAVAVEEIARLVEFVSFIQLAKTYI